MRVPARVGLVGNPSDGYGGAVLAAVVDELAAEVTVTPTSSRLRIDTDRHDAIEWSTPQGFVDDIATRGHPDPVRIVTAALTVVARHLGGPPPPVHIRCTTSIPRSVGLAGSSAIATGVVEALAAIVGEVLDPRVVAALALRAETDELAIAAGWQDRIAQAHRRAVLVDAANPTVADGLTVPGVTVVPPPSGRAVVAWLAGGAEDSGRYHAELRRRASAAEVAAVMAELAALARRAATAAARGDSTELARAVEASWSLRRAAMPLRADHDTLVETARRAGGAATSPGSGGSVVALVGDDDAASRSVIEALRDAGADTLVVHLR